MTVPSVVQHATGLTLTSGDAAQVALFSRLDLGPDFEIAFDATKLADVAASGGSGIGLYLCLRGDGSPGFPAQMGGSSVAAPSEQAYADHCHGARIFFGLKALPGQANTDVANLRLLGADGTRVEVAHATGTPVPMPLDPSTTYRIAVSRVGAVVTFARTAPGGEVRTQPWTSPGIGALLAGAIGWRLMEDQSWRIENIVAATLARPA